MLIVWLDTEEDKAELVLLRIFIKFKSKSKIIKIKRLMNKNINPKIITYSKTNNKKFSHQ